MAHHQSVADGTEMGLTIAANGIIMSQTFLTLTLHIVALRCYASRLGRHCGLLVEQYKLLVRYHPLAGDLVRAQYRVAYGIVLVLTVPAEVGIMSQAYVT